MHLPKPNPNALGEIHQAISRINQELGVTVLLVEQKLPFARKVVGQFCGVAPWLWARWIL